MGRTELSVVEKTRALTLLEQGMSVISIVADLKVSRKAIYNLMKAAASLPPGTVPPRREEGSAIRRGKCYQILPYQPQTSTKIILHFRKTSHSVPTAKEPENACLMC
ncbi:hypothetical protein OTU49_010162 [Cherax quadricarinatus]|uniref:Uncharacterized protein n=1 Tax=Cherax quadricarinatus TaxID=27406 RepID=A0AAW0W969_CHEQU